MQTYIYIYVLKIVIELNYIMPIFERNGGAELIIHMIFFL